MEYWLITYEFHSYGNWARKLNAVSTLKPATWLIGQLSDLERRELTKQQTIILLSALPISAEEYEMLQKKLQSSTSVAWRPH